MDGELKKYEFAISGWDIHLFRPHTI